jgi:hypothetical protein
MANTYTQGPRGGDQVPTLVGMNAVEMNPLTNPTFGAGDTILVGPIPAGAMLLDFRLDFPQLDTSTSVTLDVGTDLSTTNQGIGTNGFIALSTTGRSSTYNVVTPSDPLYQHGSLPFVYVPKASAITVGVLPLVCNLMVTIHTAAGSATTTGTIYGYYRYFMVDNANARNTWM